MNLDFKVGDQIKCSKRNMLGFVTRLNAVGLSKKGAVGVQWTDGKRDTVVGLDCMYLQKV